MKRYTKEELLEKLQEASQKLGNSFKAKDFKVLTGIDYHAVSRAFGSWHDAMIEAGLAPLSSRRFLSTEMLISEAKALANKMGRSTLTIYDWRTHGSCDDGVVRRKFGSWSRFLTSAGLLVGNPQDIPNEALLSELHRLRVLLGKKVSPNDMDSKGAYSSSTYIRRWGSWNAAWSCYVDSPYSSVSPPEPLADSSDSSLGKFGEIINIPGMLHAPVNEYGVIYLFALASKKLGFMVEAIQGGFPDAIAKRKLPGQRYYEAVRIEFEFQSSTFKKHRHDPKGCDLIVCWEHDWKECPLAVLELRKVFESLRP
jgi:hypothetical protein